MHVHGNDYFRYINFYILYDNILINKSDGSQQIVRISNSS